MISTNKHTKKNSSVGVLSWLCLFIPIWLCFKSCLTGYCFCSILLSLIEILCALFFFYLCFYFFYHLSIMVKDYFLILVCFLKAKCLLAKVVDLFVCGEWVIEIDRNWRYSQCVGFKEEYTVYIDLFLLLFREGFEIDWGTIWETILVLGGSLRNRWLRRDSHP